MWSNLRAMVSIVEAILGYHCGVLAAVLYRSSRLRALPFLLGLLAIHMGLNIAESQGVSAGSLNGTFPIAYGALFYLFIREVVYAELSDSGTALWLLPFLVVLTLHITGFELLSWLPIANGLVLAGSMTASTLLLFRYRRAMPQVRADAATFRLRWLYSVLAGFAVITALDLMRIQLLSGSVNPSVEGALFILTLLAVLGLTTVLAWGAYQHVIRGGSLVRQDVHTLADLDAAEHPEDQATCTRIVEDLRSLLDREPLHRQPQLRLAEIADQLGRHPREVSRAINLCLETSFSVFINKFRIAEVCQALNESPETRPSILDLAFAAGFNSKSTFNEIFKRETGMTPTEYAASDKFERPVS